MARLCVVGMCLAPAAAAWEWWHIPSSQMCELEPVVLRCKCAVRSLDAARQQRRAAYSPRRRPRSGQSCGLLFGTSVQAGRPHGHDGRVLDVCVCMLQGSAAHPSGIGTLGEASRSFASSYRGSVCVCRHPFCAFTLTVVPATHLLLMLLLLVPLILIIMQLPPSRRCSPPAQHQQQRSHTQEHHKRVGAPHGPAGSRNHRFPGYIHTCATTAARQRGCGCDCARAHLIHYLQVSRSQCDAQYRRESLAWGTSPMFDKLTSANPVDERRYRLTFRQ